MQVGIGKHVSLSMSQISPSSHPPSQGAKTRQRPPVQARPAGQSVSTKQGWVPWALMELVRFG